MMTLHLLIFLTGRSHDAAAYRWTEVATSFTRRPDIYFPLDGYIVAGNLFELFYLTPAYNKLCKYC